MQKKLYKSRTNKKIDGVCAGLAEYLDIDVTAVRLVFILLVILGFSGILIYIICMLLMPAGSDFIER